jgi:hypothetical protein
MLTEDEIRLAGDALLLHTEKPDAWFAPIAELEPVAHELFVKGYLHRGQQDDGQTVYQLTRAARQAQTLHNAAVATASTITNN